MSIIKSYATNGADQLLKPFEFKLEQLSNEEVEIKVEYCGICYSDVSMIENSWQMTQYPIVPGHEVVGEIIGLGKNVTNLKIGDKVGLGWTSKSCMKCASCMSGDHNLCGSQEMTIVGRHGGFADKVRCHWSWAIPLPDGLNIEKAGPLFCGGITVFNPIVQFDIKPTDRVGVIGIGGLGHMALQFLNKWGCHVTAFSSTAAKTAEAKKFGAHEVVNSKDDKALESIANSLDFLLVTVNVPMNWNLYLNSLKPKGKLHIVGAVMEPIPVPSFSLIVKQLSISGSPIGSPENTKKMLEFCDHHKIELQTELFPMSKVNDALSHLKDGNARYRIVLKADF